MAVPSVERRLAAILAADVVGYSRLMGEDEEDTLRLLHGHRDIIDRLIGEHHGRIFGTAGDSVIADFPSAVQAVRCAADIQGAVGRLNEGLPEGRRMQLRIGVNLGDVMVDGTNLQGDGVNVAARIEALAEPGDICISGSIHEQVRGKLEFGYEALGERRLKNIAEPVRIYRVQTEPGAAGKTRAKRKRLPWIAAAAAVLLLILGGVAIWGLYLPPPMTPPTAPDDTALALPDRPSIAVLPFNNMSADPEQEYFSDGITEDLITDLSRISGLFVIARNSVFTYKGLAVKVEDVARELGVRYVLEGSVRKAGNRVRINAQLIDATTGFHLWADRFDRELEDVFALQDEVTEHIVSALEIELTETERESLAHRYTDSLEAYDLFLRGWEQYWRFSDQSSLEARRLFERAIELDPQFARAYANLAMTYTGNVGGLSALSMDRAYELAQQAILLDDTVPQVHWVMGLVHLFRGHYAEAIASSDRALALDPNYADAYAQLAWILQYAGKPDEAQEALDNAMRLNPRFPFAYLFVQGETQFALRRYEDAIETFKRGLRRNPNAQRFRIFLAAAYAQAGRLDDAAWEVTELLTLDPDFTLDRVHEVAPYQDPETLNRLLDGLRKAGLT